jgi:hypothetical protein
MTKKKVDQRAAAQGRQYELNKPIVVPSGLQAADVNSWAAVERQKQLRVLEAFIYYNIHPDSDGAMLSLVEALIADRFPKSFETITQLEAGRKGGVPDALLDVVMWAVDSDKKRAKIEGRKPTSIRAVVKTLKKEYKPDFKGFSEEALRMAYKRQMKKNKNHQPVPIEMAAKPKRTGPKRP